MSDTVFDSCPKTHWDNGARKCPHGCGVDCKRNTQKQREHGKKLAKRLESLTRDDMEWLLGVGRYGQ